jgi:hypothetical protein
MTDIILNLDHLSSIAVSVFCFSDNLLIFFFFMADGDHYDSFGNKKYDKLDLIFFSTKLAW